MGTLTSFRKAYGALKDTTTVGLAKVNSEFKELDIAVVKATNHVECPPKERHVRKIFSATSLIRPRADVAYCIQALAKRLSKTRNWIVAIKTLIVVHRTIREGDATFRDELLKFCHRGNILQISNFKDDSSPIAWDCSAWVRTYSLFLEERLECFRILKYDIEAECLTKSSPRASKAHSRTRILNRDELLEQLPALQQLLYRLIGCQPEGGAYTNFLIQYALALVLKESFKIYCAINNGIISLVDMFFDMSRHDAVKALNVYRRAGQQAQNLADFYEFCKSLELARNFQFPTLRQPPASFLATMEEYIKEAPQSSLVLKRLEHREAKPACEKAEEPSEIAKQSETLDDDETLIDEQAEIKNTQVVEEAPPLISPCDTEDILGLNAELNTKMMEIEESNALALAIVAPEPGNDPRCSTKLAGNEDGKEEDGSGWELALVAAPSNHSSAATQTKLGGGFDQLLLDSLYEDEAARRQIELQNAGQWHGYGGGSGGGDGGGGLAMTSMQNPFDPFVMSNAVAPPLEVQMTVMAHQQQQLVVGQQLMVVPHHQLSPPQPHQFGSANPFLQENNHFFL